MKNRIEHDLLGEREVPENCYWGIHTIRAQENFELSGIKVSHLLIKSIALVKKSCCETNVELGYIDAKIGNAICKACDEISQGKYQDQFPLDALQGGAGTSTNMNVNEVIANVALESLGKQKGDYGIVDPLAHVNMHQSTNDVYPTALKIAAIVGVRRLSESAALLQGSFQKKEKEFSSVVTMGRTELQYAVPMTLGSQFASFAEAIGRDRWRTFKCEERLRVVNIGGTAIGTGMAAPKRYIFLVIEKLRANTGLGLMRAENAMDQTANTDVFVEVAGMLAANAVNLQKIANDLRMLHCFGDIILPSVQAGSSMMPGKINPVICEAVINASVKVKSNVSLVNETASMGTFQINEFLPVMGHALLESLDILQAANEMLVKHVDGIFCNTKTCLSHVDESVTIITAFLPELGYERSQKLLQEYSENSGVVFKTFLTEKLGQDLVEKILSPQRLMALGYSEVSS